MKCTAARQVLADAERERDNAQLLEVMAAEGARHTTEHCERMSYDWAAVRKARYDVRCWEARCDGAEVALTSCLGRARHRAMLERLLTDEQGIIRALRVSVQQNLAEHRVLKRAFSDGEVTMRVLIQQLNETSAVADELYAHYLRRDEIQYKLAEN